MLIENFPLDYSYFQSSRAPARQIWRSSQKKRCPSGSGLLPKDSVVAVGPSLGLAAAMPESTAVRYGEFNSRFVPMTPDEKGQYIQRIKPRLLRRSSERCLGHLHVEEILCNAKCLAI
jgi:hypothetical protein